MEDEQEFLIVVFVETGEVSTIRKSWKFTIDRETYCYWPEKNLRQQLVKDADIDIETWEQWQIRVLTSSDNLKEALVKERLSQEISDAEVLSRIDTTAKRKRFASKRLLQDDTDSDESEDLPSPKNLPCNSFPQYSKKPKTIETTNSKTQIMTTPPSKHPTFSHTSSRPVTPENAESSPTILSFHSVDTAEEGRVYRADEVDQKFTEFMDVFKVWAEKINRSLTTLSVDVSHCKDVVKDLEGHFGLTNSTAAFPDEGLMDFESKLPFKSVSDIEALENFLQIDGNDELVFSFLRRIGGSTIEEFVKRMLVRLITNELATCFSWEGRTGKKTLKNLRIIKLMSRVVSSGPLRLKYDHKAFESKVREWFRQAQTRINSKKKRSLSVMPSVMKIERF